LFRGYNFGKVSGSTRGSLSTREGHNMSWLSHTVKWYDKAYNRPKKKIFFLLLLSSLLFLVLFSGSVQQWNNHFQRRIAECCHSNDNTETLMSTIITLIRWVLIDFSTTCQFGLVLEYFHLFWINQMLELKAIVVTKKMLLITCFNQTRKKCWTCMNR